MVSVTNETKYKLESHALEAIAERVLEGEGKAGEELSIVLVNEEKSADLNKQYRGKEQAANVLSFPVPELGLGEIVLCPAIIEREAEAKYGILFHEAATLMLVHGVLHLLGYDHEGDTEQARTMEEKEQAYLAKLAPMVRVEQTTQ